MKATLEFNLPEDQSMFNVCSKSLDWYMVVLNLDYYLRDKLKHEDNSNEIDGLILNVREKMRNLMDDAGLSLEDVE